MFSTKTLSKESFPVALILKASAGPNSKAEEVVYYTEPTRDNPTQEKPFEKQIEKYLVAHEKDHIYELDPEYRFEMMPTITHEGKSHPRFINFYLSASNSGKSYQIAQLIRRYIKQFPQNLVCYASANPLENDSNYKDIIDKIQEIDVLKLESTIDFSDEQFRNSLWIFDDCDSGFTANMESLDKRLTKQEIEKMSLAEKQKALKMLKSKCDMATEWVNRSIQSFMMNGRKMSQSLCVVSHKPNEGRFENKIINEASGVVLFPASIRKNVLQTFMIEKLSVSKEQASDLMTEMEWYQYDYLYISHRTSRQFAIGVDFIKLL